MKNTLLNGESKNIVAENIQQLKLLFPEVFAEDSIDFDKLKAVLGEYLDDDDERYNFTWWGKSRALRLAQTPSTGTLRPCPEESKDWSTTKNLYIEGDNLEVLKLLQKTYHNKIKMIYIDPPYNTGKDFVYKDDYKDNIQNYLKITGQVTEKGRKISTNSETSGRYHTNWLNMMYPRLRLARNLLRDDGVIFISIDDNEVNNLRKICDEIFGEENLLSVHHIQVRYGQKSLNERKDFQELLEYVLIYSKTNIPINFNKPKKEYPIDKFNLKITHAEMPSKQIVSNGRKVDIWLPGNFSVTHLERGSIDYFKETWISGSILSGTGHGMMYTKVIDSRRKEDGDGCLYRIYGIGEDGLGFRYYTNPKDDKYSRGKMYTKVPLKILDSVKKGSALKESPIINFYDYSGDIGNIRHEGGIAFNAGKKPVKMLSHFLNYLTDKDFTVLDFFSGSASTAHAAMQLNAEDGGKRNFIMVQLPELTDKRSDDYKAGYESICDIGKERIRLAGDQIKAELAEKYQAQQGQMLVSEEEKVMNPDDLDIGFKVFKLDSSNLRKWQPDAENLDASLFASIDNFVEGRSELDVVYEIMLKYGIDLTLPIEEYKEGGKTIFSVGLGALMICLDKNITTEVAQEIVRLKGELNPEVMRVVFRDTGFKDDSTKTNTKEILRTNGVDEIVSI